MVLLTAVLKLSRDVDEVHTFRSSNNKNRRLSLLLNLQLDGDEKHPILDDKFSKVQLPSKMRKESLQRRPVETGNNRRKRDYQGPEKLTPNSIKTIERNTKHSNTNQDVRIHSENHITVLKPDQAREHTVLLYGRENSNAGSRDLCYPVFSHTRVENVNENEYARQEEEERDTLTSC